MKQNKKQTISIHSDHELYFMQRVNQATKTAMQWGFYGAGILIQVSFMQCSDSATRQPLKAVFELV